MKELKYDNLDLRSDQDIAEVARIHCEAPGEWAVDHSYSADSVLRTIKNLRSSGQSHYVVLARNLKNEIVGLHWVQLEDQSEVRLGNVLSLWVHSKYRQQGVATRLKELAECWLRSSGASEIRTKVYVENTKMIALNKKLGYRVVLFGMSKDLD